MGHQPQVAGKIFPRQQVHAWPEAQGTRRALARVCLCRGCVARVCECRTSLMWPLVGGGSSGTRCSLLSCPSSRSRFCMRTAPTAPQHSKGLQGTADSCGYAWPSRPRPSRTYGHEVRPDALPALSL